MSASLAAAKRRRAPGAVNTGPTFTTTPQPSPPRPPASAVTPEIAIKMIGARVGSLEQFTRTNLTAIENKFGEQDKFLVENFSTVPDIEQVNAAFDDLDKRVGEVEKSAALSGLEKRVIEIEETAVRSTKIEEDLDKKITALEQKIAELANLEKRLTKLENNNSNDNNSNNKKKGKQDEE